VKRCTTNVPTCEDVRIGERPASELSDRDKAAWREVQRFLRNFKTPAQLHEDLNELRNKLAELHAPPETLAVLLGLQCNTEGDVERYGRLVRAGHCFFTKVPP
jgi:hypothetical protein